MKSIRSKMALFVTVIICFIVAVQVIINLFIANPYFVSQKKKAIYSLYESLEKNYSDDVNNLYNIISSFEEMKGLKVEIFDDNNKLIYTTGRRISEGFDFEDGYISNIEYSEDPKIIIMKGLKTDTESLSLHGVINTSNGRRYVMIETPLVAINDSVEVLNHITLYIAFFAIILGIIAAYIYATKFSVPIKEIDKVAQNVAALDFSQKADETSSHNEIASLAHSINMMSDKLSSFIEELVDKNELLHNDNEYLIKSEETRREFIANVSHELKSPLALVIGYAEILKNNISGLNKDMCLDIIIEEGSKMNEMIKCMLNVSSIENGLKDLKVDKVNFTDFINNIITKEATLLKDKNVILTSEIEDGCIINGDKFYLDQAVNNYIQNAISHTSQGGKVEIKLKHIEDRIVFSVYNDGKQIPKEKIDRIWDSFYKTDEARTRSEGNNIGLGLYIVKTIITSHKGEYGVRNKGDGVEFWFSL